MRFLPRLLRLLSLINKTILNGCSGCWALDRLMGRVYSQHVLRFLVIVALLGTWFMPLIIAALYKLPHQGPVAVLSLLLGWTGVGWLAALIIAVGGAIRATRPALASDPRPQAGPAAGSYGEASYGAGSHAAAQPHAPAQSAWPASDTTAPAQPAASPQPQPSRRAQSAEGAQPAEEAQRPARPSWPDNPR
jgi:hypothetical protein